MSAIVIQADPKSNKILVELAKKLGGNVLAIGDFGLGFESINEDTILLIIVAHREEIYRNFH
jgi:mRNA-degrading endonuclease RelE of RelBE toxin-antitoxin system